MFGKKEVATVTGMGGMMGYLGATAFTLVFGVLVTQVGYSPLFVVLAIFDLIAAAAVCLLARQTDPTSGTAHPATAAAPAR